MLVAFCVLIPIWFAYTRSKSVNGYEVNHVTLFTFGFLFYWVVPVAAAPFVKEQTGEVWSGLFDGVSQLRTYEWTVLLSYVAFALGECTATKIFSAQKGTPRPLHPGALFLPVPILCVTLLATVVMYHGLLFQAYDVDVDAARAKGTVAASVVILGSIALLYFSDHADEPFTTLAKRRFVLPFLLGALFLLVLGTRLYVVSFVLMFFTYKSCFVRPVPLKLLLTSGAIVAGLSGLVGILRISDSNGSIWVNLILEPLFTSFSLLYFLSVDTIPLIAFPKYLLTDLANLVPTFLLPGKATLVTFPFVYNPLGALHSFVSCAYNFGIIGTILVMFCIPFTLRWFRSRSGSQLARVIYTMLSGWLAFSFFRDPFAVSIVKAMLEFSVIIPSMLYLFAWYMETTTSIRIEVADPHVLVTQDI